MQEILDGHEIKALLDFFSEGIVLTDSSSSLRWMNPMAEFLFCVQCKDWIGKPIQAMIDKHQGLEWVFDDKQPENLRCWQVMGCKDQNCSLWGKLFTDCWTNRTCPLCVSPGPRRVKRARARTDARNVRSTIPTPTTRNAKSSGPTETECCCRSAARGYRIKRALRSEP